MTDMENSKIVLSGGNGMKSLHRIITIYSFILIILALSSCTPGKAQTKKNFPNKTNNEYNDIYAEENNEFNETLEDFSQLNNKKNRSEINKFFQKGHASWYGREYHGKETASGEKFDMYQYTAAHKTLPFGTIVMVNNIENGKSVRVKINERGPYSGNRIIDLSYSAAKKLGMLGTDKAVVGINIISAKNENVNYEYKDEMDNNNVEPVVDDRESNMNYDDYSENNSNSNYSIQVGAFFSKRNAEKLKEKVDEITNQNSKIVREEDLYKVRIEGILSKKDSQKYKKILENEEIPAYIINSK